MANHVTSLQTIRVSKDQKEDSEIWTIIENLDKQVEFRIDEDNVLCGMKRDVATFVSRCLICQQVKIEHQRASGLLQPLNIPVWKWDEISMDFVTGLPRTQRRHDAIWVVVDRLTKSAHFLPIRKDYSVSRLAEIFQQEIVRLHGTPSAIVSDRDPRFTSRFWKGLQKAWGTRLKKLGEPGLSSVLPFILRQTVKENHENDKNRSKLDKKGKRGEDRKSLKQLQLKEEEKPKKTKKEWPKTHARIKSY
nr:retrotransposable element Tf2 [Tanacetum cinerariifolium]